jgi:PilZ domain
MDQRREPRLDAAGPARVTLLGEPRKQVGGRIINSSGQGIRLILDEPVSPGALLAVEWADTEAMGEVCYCEQTDGGFAAGVRLEHMLLHTTELARLAARLLGEPEAERVTGSARPV